MDIEIRLAGGVPMNEPLRLLLDAAVRLFQEELPAALTGIYAHGSLAMGCYNPERSDIDLLVIVREPSARETYRRIADKLIRSEEAYPIGKGFELSIVLEAYAQEFVYPTPFEFHYSATHRDRYRHDDQYVCGGFEDPDLAAHFAVAYSRGITLYGKPIRDVFNPIDRRFYLESVMADVRESAECIAGNPEYCVLNLCRTLRFLREASIASKLEGGQWAAEVVPQGYREIIEQCLASYKGDSKVVTISGRRLAAFADYMLREIEYEAGKGNQSV